MTRIMSGASSQISSEFDDRITRLENLRFLKVVVDRYHLKVYYSHVMYEVEYPNPVEMFLKLLKFFVYVHD